MSNPISLLHADLEKILTEHGTQISDALDTAARVADNPAAQMVLGLLNIPPATAEAFAGFLQKMDADFGKLQPTESVVPEAPAAGSVSIPAVSPETMAAAAAGTLRADSLPKDAAGAVPAG